MASTWDYLGQLLQDKQDLAANLYEQGVEASDEETFTTLVPKVLDIQTGGGGETPEAPENDVEFYDYNGKRLYSYSASDFLNLTEMPANPEHEGLTAQGWNFTLEKAKEYVNDYGTAIIGQIYTTSDDKTRIYISLEETRKTPWLGFAVNGSVTIDWGDGQTQTVTGTSTSTLINTWHGYAHGGNYVITLGSESLIYFLGTGTVFSELLWAKVTSSSYNENAIYRNSIKKIECGSNIRFGSNYALAGLRNMESIVLPNALISYAQRLLIDCSSLRFCAFKDGSTSIGDQSTFSGCYSLKTVSIPDSVRNWGGYLFQNCYSLEKVVMPSQATTVGINTFQTCYSLKKLIVSKNAINLGNYCFNNCHSLTTLKLSNKITSIGSSVFNGTLSVMYYDFSDFTSVPTLSNYNFIMVATDYEIHVPSALYETWIAATKWSDVASHIVAV